MKIKNNIFDKMIIKNFLNVLAIIELVLSLILIFCDIPQDYRKLLGLLLIILLIIIYAVIWYLSNKLNKVTLYINNSEVEIKYGDIFAENGKKVIAFNEYFDTIVDDKIINRKSLNGQFINNKVDDINELNRVIEQGLQERRKKSTINSKRLVGKKERFTLGTTVKYNNEFLLTAFTRFNDENHAELSMQEYIMCLIELWNELDTLYSQDIIVIPLLGSGATRFKDYTVSEQELLELMLWTFKISKIKFSYPSKLCIIIYKQLKDKINLYKIKEEY